MRALIAGARGFIGRHTAMAFAEAGHEVVGLGHGAWTSHREWGVTTWSGLHINVANLVNWCRDVDVIVNCAGSATVPFSFQNPLEDLDRNVNAMAAILECVRLHSPQTSVIMLSSAAVYGVTDASPIAEDISPRPTSPYGRHKWISEELCRSYATHFGMSVAIARLFSVYGPTLRKQLLWDACHKFHNREATFFGTGRETRDWIYVTDAAALLLAIARCEREEFVLVNGGSGMGTTNERVLRLTAERMDFLDPIVFSGKARVGDPEHYVADIAQARKIGWSPRVSLEDGIATYVRWFLSETPRT